MELSEILDKTDEMVRFISPESDLLIFLLEKGHSPYFHESLIEFFPTLKPEELVEKLITQIRKWMAAMKGNDKFAFLYNSFFPDFFNLSMSLERSLETALEISDLKRPLSGNSWSLAFHGLKKARTIPHLTTGLLLKSLSEIEDRFPLKGVFSFPGYLFQNGSKWEVLDALFVQSRREEFPRVVAKISERMDEGLSQGFDDPLLRGFLKDWGLDPFLNRSYFGKIKEKLLLLPQNKGVFTLLEPLTFHFGSALILKEPLQYNTRS